MAQNIADYKVLFDNNSFVLPLNQENDYNFTLQDDYVAGTQTQRPVIAFMFDPSSDASSLRYEVSINGSQVTSLSSISSGLKRANWTAFDGDLLENDGNNTIVFRVEGPGGIGAIEFSDIVLWYQRDLS